MLSGEVKINHLARKSNFKKHFYAGTNREEQEIFYG